MRWNEGGFEVDYSRSKGCYEKRTQGPGGNRSQYLGSPGNNKYPIRSLSTLYEAFQARLFSVVPNVIVLQNNIHRERRTIKVTYGMIKITFL